jgi:hypothetical protein
MSMSPNASLPDSTPTGASGVGAMDASVGDPAREYRIFDNVSRAFATNEQVDMPADQSSHIGEPGVIAWANKIAQLKKLAFSMDERLVGIEKFLPPRTLVEMRREGTDVEQFRERAAKLRQKAAAAGIAAPVAPPAAPKMPSATMKPVKAFDPRTDKPEGMNLTQGVQTLSYGADTGNSYTSFARRLQGSPV